MYLEVTFRGMSRFSFNSLESRQKMVSTQVWIHCVPIPIMTNSYWTTHASCCLLHSLRTALHALGAFSTRSIFWFFSLTWWCRWSKPCGHACLFGLDQFHASHVAWFNNKLFPLVACNKNKSIWVSHGPCKNIFWWSLQINKKPINWLRYMQACMALRIGPQCQSVAGQCLA